MIDTTKEETTMSIKQVEQIRNENLAASLRRVLGRPAGLRLVTADERPDPAELRRARVRSECATVYGEVRP